MAATEAKAKRGPGRPPKSREEKLRGPKLATEGKRVLMDYDDVSSAVHGYLALRDGSWRPVFRSGGYSSHATCARLFDVSGQTFESWVNRRREPPLAMAIIAGRVMAAIEADIAERDAARLDAIAQQPGHLARVERERTDALAAHKAGIFDPAWDFGDLDGVDLDGVEASDLDWDFGSEDET